MHLPVELELVVLFGLLLLAVALPMMLGCSAVVWGARTVLGLRTGVLTGWVVLAALPLVPIFLGYQFTVEAAVPSEIVGGELIDNDGAVRSLFFLTVFSIPGAIAAAVAVWLSIRSFNHRLKSMASA